MAAPRYEIRECGRCIDGRVKVYLYPKIQRQRGRS